ncbi:MAG: ABC transporter permease [Desulfomonilaceae bacterium]|nr:ABC transporter permease [Desulfomonilaceae bacterium]
MRLLGMGKQAVAALADNKSRTFLMMLGIVIGVATLTIITSSVLGARAKVMKNVGKFGFDQIAVFAGSGKKLGVFRSLDVTTLTLEDAEAMEAEIGNIREVTPQINRRNVPVKHGNLSSYATLVCANPNWSSVWQTRAARGRFISDEDVSRLARVAVIGETMVEDLFAGRDPVGEQILINNLPFKVIGILEKRGTSPAGVDMDGRILIPLSTGQKRVFNIDHLGMIKVALKDPAKMDATVGDVAALLRERHRIQAGTEDDFTIVTPTQAMTMASKISSSFTLFLVLVSAVSLIVGAIVIANIMFIGVNERRAEIGIRRAVGAKKQDILIQFLIESLMVAVGGGIIGVVTGLLGLKGLSFFMKFPSALMWQPIVLALFCAILVGLLAGIQPARKAAGMNPVEALK